MTGILFTAGIAVILAIFFTRSYIEDLRLELKVVTNKLFIEKSVTAMHRENALKHRLEIYKLQRGLGRKHRKIIMLQTTLARVERDLEALQRMSDIPTLTQLGQSCDAFHSMDTELHSSQSPAEPVAEMG